ncbi:potassium channel family protein [Pseudoalteromonas sp. KAN5]|uniref:potassium channel family protein n=1 Tax=Pseudoalteromonas sp. KAN5 TaxID=2916633 RepID=UPI001FCA69E7|nr:potassium channel family protein [Pseudoalteromonas sp. KAN5]BDF95111.1 hypothetical protein KAN5_19490 [Pseudoalteromonas sp. KAN5]
MEFSITFFQLFFIGVYLGLPLLAVLCFVIIGLGLVVGRLESWSRFDSIYWAFITALTVGYGDIRPLKKPSKVLAVIIAWTGILLTGLLVAIAVKTASITLEIFIDPNVIEQLEKRV